MGNRKNFSCWPAIFFLVTAALTEHVARGTNSFEGSFGYFEESFDDKPVAVSVATTTPHTGYAQSLALPDIVVDIGAAWNPETNDVTIIQDGVYFIHLSAGAQPGQRINLDLLGADKGADIMCFSTSHDGLDTRGRDFVTTVSNGSRLSLENIDGSSLYSDGGRQTSLVVFDLGRYLDGGQPAIFSGARRSSLTTTGPVAFPDVVKNHPDFDSNAGTFTAKEGGVYYFTLSVGVPKAAAVNVTLTAGELELGRIQRTTSYQDGLDMNSLSLMALLTVGDVVSVSLEAGQLHSDADRQTTFAGFLHQGNGTAKPAWSVYRTSPYPADLNDTYIDLEPIPFDGFLVNVEDIFDPATNQINVSTSGLYYVSLNVAVTEGDFVDVSVMRYRGRTEFNIYRTADTHSGTDALSHGLLLKLSQGDVLAVIQAEGSRVYSDQYGGTRFTGFLVAELLY